MSNPWDFDDESKFLFGFLGFMLAVVVLGYHGCSADERSKADDRRSTEVHKRIDGEVQKIRGDVQIACLKAGHTALECKELR